ncbi:hypothetical protein AGOR_G00032820 [Albula goreensis]|uniref:Uncharacterized protein n=1 Tax=Albula goreensis TaxID=1534307 RepID=A0A8T3DW25_9TELE|nr:hypothetical protein AGOR_G00032820 [Albula goreensis]
MSNSRQDFLRPEEPAWPIRAPFSNDITTLRLDSSLRALQNVEGGCRVSYRCNDDHRVQCMGIFCAVMTEVTTAHLNLVKVLGKSPPPPHAVNSEKKNQSPGSDTRQAERCRTSSDPDAPDQAADEEPLHVEDEGSEDAEDEGDPALHHPAPPSGKAPTRPAALRPVPSPPTQQTAPLQPSTAGAPGTDPEERKRPDVQLGYGACGEEGRRAHQAVDCSPTRGQAPPPLPFPSPGQADGGPFPGNLSPEPVSTAFILLSSCSTHGQGSETGGQVVKGELFSQGRDNGSL